MDSTDRAIESLANNPALNPQPITEVEIFAWIAAAELRTGIDGAKVTVYNGTLGPRVMIDACGQLESAGTFDRALALIKAKIKMPAELAAEKRAEAAKLLAEAAELEGKQ